LRSRARLLLPIAARVQTPIGLRIAGAAARCGRDAPRRLSARAVGAKAENCQSMPAHGESRALQFRRSDGCPALPFQVDDAAACFAHEVIVVRSDPIEVGDAVSELEQHGLPARHELLQVAVDRSQANAR